MRPHRRATADAQCKLDSGRGLDSRRTPMGHPRSADPGVRQARRRATSRPRRTVSSLEMNPEPCVVLRPGRVRCESAALPCRIDAGSAVLWFIAMNIADVAHEVSNLIANYTIVPAPSDRACAPRAAAARCGRSAAPNPTGDAGAAEPPDSDAPQTERPDYFAAPHRSCLDYHANKQDQGVAPRADANLTVFIALEPRTCWEPQLNV